MRFREQSSCPHPSMAMTVPRRPKRNPCLQTRDGRRAGPTFTVLLSEAKGHPIHPRHTSNKNLPPRPPSGVSWSKVTSSHFLSIHFCLINLLCFVTSFPLSLKSFIVRWREPGSGISIRSRPLSAFPAPLASASMLSNFLGTSFSRRGNLPLRGLVSVQWGREVPHTAAAGG